MAYRGIRGSDPFASKTTRNERFAQMSKQEQLIEQKKREIQLKLEDQKKKETEEALKKLQGAASGSTRSGVGSKSNFQSGQHKGSRRTFWKSNQDQRWKRESSHAEDTTVPNKSFGSMNIFSNDGSFLDQFKKLSGVKEAKPKKDDETAVINNPNDTKSSTSSSTAAESATLTSTNSAQKSESDDDWGTWDGSSEKTGERDRSEQSGEEIKSEELNDGERKDDGDGIKEDLQNSERLGTSHWFHQDSSGSGAWQQGQEDTGMSWGSQDSPPPTSKTNRPSSPYSPSRISPDTKDNIQNSETSNPPPQYPLPNVPPPSAIPVLISSSPQQHFIPYTAPPPLHSIPPPSPLQPHSIPPPRPMQPHTIPTPPAHVPTLSVQPQPAPIIASIQQLPPQAPLPPAATLQNLHPASPTIPSHIIQHPPPLLQRPPSYPGLGSSIPAPACPPPPPMAVHGIAAGICAATGIGENGVTGGQTDRRPSDKTVDPAADEARNHLARTVAQCGDDIEQIIVIRNPDDPNLWFLNDKECNAYKEYRELVEKYRLELNPIRDEESEKDSNEYVKRELNEYGSQGDTKVEMIDEKSADNRSGRQDQEDDNSRQSEASSKRSGDDSDEGQASAVRRRKRRSRWAPENDKVTVVPSPTVAPVGGNGVSVGIPAMGVIQQPPVAAGIGTGGGPMLTKVTRTDPALIQYAMQAFGTKNLSEEDWKKAEDHYKINLLYQDMLRKRQELERLQKAGKFKYEYDSDEETDGGTWEHRLRLQEMEATQRWAEELTKKAEGKHHIGDFLPPDELERFLEK
ncbi:hypothetical protein L9F63_010259, partial [Diploptera punctata]